MVALGHAGVNQNGRRSCWLAAAAIACATALLLFMAAPSTIYAEELASNGTRRFGDFTVKTGADETADVSWDEGSQRLTVTSGSLTVSNTNPSTATNDVIYIRGTDGSVPIELTLDGVNIATTDQNRSPIEIDNHATSNVVIKLAGENILSASGDIAAGIEKSNGQRGDVDDVARLKITSASGDGSTAGVLRVTTSGRLASAIGAADASTSSGNGDCKGITIAGGTVHASATGEASSGIGASGYGSAWNISITGGVVYASSIGDAGMYYTHNSTITGGYVITGAWEGNAPTGGMVSVDKGANFVVYSDTSMPTDVTVPSNGTLTVNDGATLTIPQGITLTNNGIIYNDGGIVVEGELINNGTIWNGGPLGKVDGSGAILNQYVEVTSGSGTGAYEAGDTVTITADELDDGRVFDHWEVTHGSDVVFADAGNATTTFTMPDGYVRIRAVYVYVQATVIYEDGTEGRIAVSEPDRRLDLYGYSNCTITLSETYPYGGNWSIDGYGASDVVLDLSGRSVRLYDAPRGTSTIRNGAISVRGMYLDRQTLTLECVDVTSEYHSEIALFSNSVLIVGEDVTFSNDVNFYNNGVIRTLCTDDRSYPGTVELMHDAGSDARIENDNLVYTCERCGQAVSEACDEVRDPSLALELEQDPVYDGEPISATVAAKRGEEDVADEVILSYRAADAAASVPFTDGLPSAPGTYVVRAVLPAALVRAKDGAVVGYNRMEVEREVTIAAEGQGGSSDEGGTGSGSHGDSVHGDQSNQPGDGQSEGTGGLLASTGDPLSAVVATCMGLGGISVGLGAVLLRGRRMSNRA